MSQLLKYVFLGASLIMFPAASGAADDWQIAWGGKRNAEGAIACGGKESLVKKNTELTGKGVIVTVQITPVEALAGSDAQYKMAGIRLSTPGDDQWVVQLSERPADQNRVHFMELRLKQNNSWALDKTKLKEIERFNTERCWEYGTTYLLKLELDDTGAAGTLYDASGAKALAGIRYEFLKPAEVPTFGQPAFFGRNLNDLLNNPAVELR